MSTAAPIEDDYPEHAKMRAVHDDAQKLGAFIEWVESGDRRIAQLHEHTSECNRASVITAGHNAEAVGVFGRDCGMFDVRNSSNGLPMLYAWQPEGSGDRIERILALYFDIDMQKINDEKEQMLARIREQNTTEAEECAQGAREP